MRWKGRRQSDNVVDAGSQPRPARGKQAAVGGGLGVLVLAVVVMLLGGDPSALLGQGALPGVETGGSSAGTVQANSPQEQEMLDFISVVLADTEDVWNQLFADMGQNYPEPTLVRFRDSVDTACGTQPKAIGPFYCSGDDSIYIDLTFFNELAKRHHAAGDFAQAYVIAHEVGHHLQNVLGITQQVAAKKRSLPEKQANRWSVRQELHADFLAGVWAHHAQRTKNILESGDLEEAINAAEQIGDDTLQRKARGYVQPDGFTHGTAAQRKRWFELGFQTGDMKVGEEAYTRAYDDL